MAREYPFINSDELKKFVSGIDADLDIGNINSSLVRAANNITDLVTEGIYTQAITHYKDTDNYNQPNEEDEGYIRLNSLVEKIQAPLAAFALYHHFIWLRLRVTNNSVVVTKNEDEERAYKYEIDEAKEELLQLAWMGVTDL